MSFTDKFLQVLRQAQDPHHCHKKLFKIIENEFKTVDTETFTKLFTCGLYKFYWSDSAGQNKYVARGLEFLAKLTMRITLLNVPPTEVPNPDGTISYVYDISTDTFFNNMLNSSLKYASAVRMETRFNTCFFITLLLQNISNNVDMDNVQCNRILEALIDRLSDNKSQLRLHAIKALTRLQEPANPDCVVMNSFLKLFIDPNAEIRREVVKVIARHPQSFVKIRERFTDSDYKVRYAAYERCADINPRTSLKIVDRNFVLTSAYDDNDKKVQQILKSKLLPKWLNFYEGHHLNFLKALRLDGDENDFVNFEKLCRNVVNSFLRINTLEEVVNGLPIDKNNKLIPIKQLNLENVMYWSNLIKFLKGRDDSDEFLDSILPELTPFSDYIERVFKEKFTVSMDEWETLNNQNIVLYLFHIASGFDFSDEVGRKKFYSLIIQTLTTYRFQPKVSELIISVASLLNTNIDSFTTDICQVISDIREPLVEDVLSEEEMRKKNFEMAKINVRLRELEITEEEALKKRDFELAKITCNEITECQRRLESFKTVEKVRVSKDDPEILCRCLDTLINLLKIRNIKLSPAIRICTEEFLMPLSTNNISEVHWRFIKCLGLLSLLDKETALQHANFICLPIATYTTVLNYDKAALKISVACITDLICFYGSSVLGLDEDSGSVSSQEQKNSRRKLYTENMDQQVTGPAELNNEFIMDIILDMLDDEDESVRNTAASSLSKLMVRGFSVNPELLSKLILKWFNPLTEQKDRKLQQQIGIIIECFSNTVKGAKKIIGDAILLIISTITKAPVGSPLLSIDMDNVLKFLGALNSIENEEDTENVHNLANTVIEMIAKNPTNVDVLHLTKLLTYLDVALGETAAQKNLISSVELLLPDVSAESKKNLLKFISKMQKNQACQDRSTTINDTQTTTESTNTTTMSEVTTNSSRLQEQDKTEAVKRRLHPVQNENAKKEKTNDGSKRGNSTNESESRASIDVSKQNGRKQLPLAKSGQKIPVVELRKCKLLGKIQEGLEVSPDVSQEKVEDSPGNVFLKYDYTHLKPATPKKNSENEKINNGTKSIQVISQVILEKSKEPNNRIEKDEILKPPVVFLTPLKKTNEKNSRKRPAFTPLSAGNHRTFKKYPRSTPMRSERTHREVVARMSLRRSYDRTPCKKRQPESPCTATKRITKKRKQDESSDETQKSSTRSERNKKINASSSRKNGENDSGKQKDNITSSSKQEGSSLRKDGKGDGAGKEENIPKSSNQETRRSLRNAEAKRKSDVKGNRKASNHESRKPSKKGEENKGVNETGKAKEKSEPSNVERRSSLRSANSRTRSGKIVRRQGNIEESTILDRRASVTKTTYSPVKSARIMRTRNLRRSLHMITKNMGLKQVSKRKIDEENGSEDSEYTDTDESTRRKNKENYETKYKKTTDKKKSSGILQNRPTRMRKNGGIKLKQVVKDIEIKKKDNNINIQDKITDSSKKSYKNQIESTTRLSRSKTRTNKALEPVEIQKKTETKLNRIADKNSTPLSIQQKKKVNGLSKNSQKQSKESETNKNKTSPKHLINNSVLKSLNSSLNKSVDTPALGTRSKKQNKKMTTRSGMNMNGNIYSKTETSTTSSSKTKLADTSTGTSRKQLEFDTSSDETLLKTFLQGDEEFVSLEEYLIEDVSSISNSSNDSKKENILNVSSSKSGSSQETRKSARKKFKPLTRSDSDSSPHRKMLRIDKNT